jgi:flagellar hook-associated protein 2
MKVGGISGLGGMGSTSMVDSIMEAERVPLKSVEQRKQRTSSVRDEFKSFDSMLTGFSSSLENLKSNSSFTKLSLESSHPELLDGSVLAGAKPGTYELEVEGLANAEKQLAFGFSDRDVTPVGFGYMRVGAGDLVKDITIDPGSTLNDVAQKINDAESGVKAMIINTGVKEDPFRLMVSSIKSGEDTVMELDPDTTFVEFKQLAKSQDLNVKFEGVDVKRASNTLDGLIEGVNLQAKRAEPGTKVQVEIKNDVPKTSNGIKEFVKQYNEIIGFGRKQSQIDPETGKPGLLSGDSALKGSIRKLQGDISSKSSGNGLTLMDVGITTDPRSGELKIDETKLTDALSKNYGQVASLFATTADGPGLAERLSNSVKQMKDRESGLISTRLKGMDQSIKNQNQQIERQENRLAKKREQLERTFAALDSKMAVMQGTSEFLGARFGNTTPQGTDPKQGV